MTGDRHEDFIELFIKFNQDHLSPPKTESLLGDLKSYVREKFKGAQQAGTAPNGSCNSTQSEPHLLAKMRKMFVGSPEGGRANDGDLRVYALSRSYQSAKELKTLGIKFKTNKSGGCSDVKFESTMFLYGKLALPRLTVDDSTKSLLLNIVAFETSFTRPDDLCVTPFICFMDSLINNAEDVEVLRSKSILLTYLSSDQHVAELFNDLAKYLGEKSSTYLQVRVDIEKHCRTK